MPTQRFADVGGLDVAKEQIRQVVQGHLDSRKYERYGLLRNGILLYGQRGTGKTFLARATAGEFGLNFEYIAAPKLLNRWIGATAENIHGVFAQAAARKPVLFFIDEIRRRCLEVCPTRCCETPSFAHPTTAEGLNMLLRSVPAQQATKAA